MPKYSIRDLSGGGIRVRFPDSWTPSKGERGKPGGGLRAAPFLFPLPAGRVGTAPLCAVGYVGDPMRAVHASSLADERLLSLMGKRIIVFSDSAFSRP